MRAIGIVTSGGDASGMNAAIRAVTRIANAQEREVYGFERGWNGVMQNNHVLLTSRSVGGIIEQGGTILRTSRSPEFRTAQGIEKAARTLASNDLEALAVIGGDGSFRGAHELSKKTSSLIIGIPASIDNDVFGTDETIGFDTAVNNAVVEIDKIRDTAVSHERVFIVEVMGRTRGFIASTVGLTVGAEVILVPEVKLDRKDIYRTIRQNSAKGKKSGVIVAAEGIGDTRKLALEIERKTGTEVRLTVLGYVQRGGNPTARSRLLASLFADKAVELMNDSRGGRIVGLRNGKITSIGLRESCSNQKPLDTNLLRLANTLAT